MIIKFIIAWIITGIVILVRYFVIMFIGEIKLGLNDVESTKEEMYSIVDQSLGHTLNMNEKDVKEYEESAIEYFDSKYDRKCTVIISLLSNILFWPKMLQLGNETKRGYNDLLVYKLQNKESEK